MDAAFDFQMPLLVVSIAGAAGIIIYLISVFGIREKTFEEAIASQKEISQELLGKKDHKKKVVKRKVKSKKEEKPHKDKDSDKESKEKEPQAQHPHVEICSEPTILDENVSVHRPSLSTQVIRRESIKSILVNKTEMSPVGDGDAVLETNHFEDRHPKDDFALKKQGSTEDELPTEHNDEVENEIEEEIIQVSEAAPLQLGTASPSAVGATELTNNITRKGSKKSKKAAQVPPVGELNAIKLVSVIEKVTMSKDEIQNLIEYLLNRQVDADVATEWVNKSKSDTSASLKKALADREAQLTEEQGKVDNLQLKLKDLRQELTTEKNRMTGTKKALEDRVTTLQQESQQFQIRIQQLNGLLSEKSALERQVQDMQRRNQALHDENLNLKKVLSADQGFRMKADGLEREAEAIRTQCSHLESQLKSSFQSNSDLAAQVRGLQDHVRGLEMKAVEFDHLQGFSAQLQERETHLLNELKLAEAKVLDSDAERNMFREKLCDSEAEIRSTKEEAERKVEESHQSEKNAKNLLQDTKTNLVQVESQLKSKELELKKVQDESSNLIEELNRRCKTLEEDELALEKRLGLAEGNVILLTAEKEALTETVAKKKGDTQNLNQKITELHEEVTKLEKGLRASASNLEAQNEAAQSHLKEVENSTRQTVLNSIQEQLETQTGVAVQKDSEAWVESFVKQMTEVLTPPIVDNTSELERLQGEVQHYQTALANTEGILSNLEKSIADSEKAWDDKLEARNAELEVAQKSSQASIGHLEVELNLQREENLKLDQTNKDLEEKVSKALKDDTISMEAIEELKNWNQELRAEVHRLNSLIPHTNSAEVANGDGTPPKTLSSSPSSVSVESKGSDHRSVEGELLSPTGTGEQKKKKKAASAKKERKT